MKFLLLATVGFLLYFIGFTSGFNRGYSLGSFGTPREEIQK